MFIILKAGVDFLRVGSKASKWHVADEIRPYILDEVARNVTTVGELEALYNSKVTSSSLSPSLAPSLLIVL